MYHTGTCRRAGSRTAAGQGIQPRSLMYGNVHTTEFPEVELRSQIGPLIPKRITAVIKLYSSLREVELDGGSDAVSEPVSLDRVVKTQLVGMKA